MMNIRSGCYQLYVDKNFFKLVTDYESAIFNVHKHILYMQAAIGFELWSMSPDIYFDNIIITDDEEVAKKWARDSFEIRRLKIAKESVSTFLPTNININLNNFCFLLCFS